MENGYALTRKEGEALLSSANALERIAQQGERLGDALGHIAQSLEQIANLLGTSTQYLERDATAIRVSEGLRRNR